MDRVSIYLRALVRRIWLVLIIFILGTGIAVATAYLLPPVYESSAKILVESQQIPQDLAQSTVPQGAAERLALIEQRLMTRDNLLDLVRRLNLFPEYTNLAPAEKVELVRKNTKFDSLSYSSGQRTGQQVSAFTITYHANSPALAARVASEFVTMVLEQNLASRSARASETFKFFDQQVDRLAGDLLELEAEIARFKNENGEALPESYEHRLSELSALESQQFDLQQRQVLLSEQRRAIERGDMLLASGGSVTPEERELQELRRQLVRKRSMLSESHPEIAALKANIGALEAAIAPLMDDAGAEAENADQSRATLMKNQLEAIDRETTLLAERLEKGEARAVEIRESLARTPKVEMQLNTYTRRHQTLQLQYSNAIQKLAAADTGQRLEVNRQAERFEVIEQAQVAPEPVAPPRMLIAAGGTLGSLALGMALALGLELVNPAIRTAADLQRQLDLRPMVTIPYMKTRYERRIRALKWLAKIIVALVVLGGLLWVVDQYVTPLTVLSARIGEKTGIDSIIQMLRMRLQ